MLLVAYRSGRQTRTMCLNQAPSSPFADDELREQFRGGTVKRLPGTPQRCAPATTSSTKLAMHNLGRRFVVIDTDCAATTT